MRKEGSKLMPGQQNTDSDKHSKDDLSISSETKKSFEEGSPSLEIDTFFKSSVKNRENKTSEANALQDISDVNHDSLMTSAKMKEVHEAYEVHEENKVRLQSEGEGVVERGEKRDQQDDEQDDKQGDESGEDGESLTDNTQNTQNSKSTQNYQEVTSQETFDPISGRTTIIHNYIQAPVENNTVGLTGFILSLVAFLLSWIPFLGGLLWLVGAILSIIGLFKAPRGFAIAGTVISFIMLFVFFFFFMGFVMLAALSSY